MGNFRDGAGKGALHSIIICSSEAWLVLLSTEDLRFNQDSALFPDGQASEIYHIKISCPDSISFSKGYIQQEYQI